MKILTIGTTRQIQEGDYENTEKFKRVLAYLSIHFGVQIIMEEWTSLKGDTVAKRLAAERKIDWRNIVTPSTAEMKTAARLVDIWQGSMIFISRYGPVDAQTRRECSMLEEIRTAMNGKEIGLLILGWAHLHSLSERLVRAGFEVEPFYWSKPETTLEF